MTLADRRVDHIVVPPVAPICPAANVAAAYDEARAGNLLSNAPMSVGNTPTTAPQATDCDGRRPESRTTLP